MIDEQQLFDRFHAAFEIEPREGMRERIRSRLIGSEAGRRSASPVRWTMRNPVPARFMPLVAALLVILVVAGVLVAINALPKAHPAPATNPRYAPGTAVWPVDERWYWSANDAGLVVNQEAGGVPWRVEITHDGGRTWTSTRFQSLGIAPTLQWFDASHLLLYDEWSHAYVTADGGETWTPVQFGLSPQINLTSFVSLEEGWTLCPTTPGCGTGTNPADDNTLYHTVDSGVHWEKLGHGFASGSLGPDHLVFMDHNHGVISTYSTEGGRLFATADGGRTWRLVALPAPSPGGARQTSNICGETYTCVYGLTMFGRNGLLLADTPDGIFSYATNDYGATWGDPHALPGRAVQPCCPINVSAGASNDWWAVDGTGALFRSTDQGKTWVQIPARLDSRMTVSWVTPVGANTLWGIAIAQDQRRFPIRSTDGGRTWSVVKLATTEPSDFPPPSPPPSPSSIPYPQAE